MTLVLLHALPLDGSIWPQALRDLAEECVAPDLYAFGDDIRDWAHGVLDLVGGESRLTLVGNSIGGSCAIEIALLAPEKVGAMVLCGTKAGHTRDPAFRDECLQVLETNGIDAAWDRYWKRLFGPATDEGVVHRAQLVARSQGVSAIASGVKAFHGRPDRDGFLDAWRGPVWMVSGEHDFRPERGLAAARRLPRGQFRQVPRSGHFVPVEAPDELGQIVTDALRAVLRP